MSATLAKALKILLSIGSTDKGKKAIRSIVIIVLSPLVAITVIIGGIFQDGISFNHNLVSNLFEGIDIGFDGLSAEQIEYIKSIQNGLLVIEDEMNEQNKTLKDGKLNEYLVKGYFIGIMFTDKKISTSDESLKMWVGCFINEDKNKKRTCITDSSKIFENIEKNFSTSLTSENKEIILGVYQSLIGEAGGGVVTTLSKEDIDKLIKNLPKDTSELRKNIIIQAADAVGKIPYYWGGAASKPGYDGNDFGKKVSPDAHGRTQKGMDCSHFVDWVYWTVVGNNLGNTNTTGQIAIAKKISKNELKPGDLGFLIENGQSTHVGVYAGTNDKGEMVWIHENGGDNNVSMNTVSYWNAYYRLNIMEGR